MEELLHDCKTFWKNRAQRVIINGVSFSTSVVASGVPQGGVLSSLHFSTYMNELPREFSFTQISMYADDAKLYAAIPQPRVTSVSPGVGHGSVVLTYADACPGAF